MNNDESVNQTRTAIVLYGTETGTSQDLAAETGRILERHHFETDLQELDNVIPQSLIDYSIVVFVLSTTGQGDFPANSRYFWTSLLKKKLTNTFLHGINYALVGIGDSSYPKFNWAARKLEKRINQLGAKSLLIPCEADEQGEDSTDGAFIAWTESFKGMLREQYPLSSGISPIPDEQALPSKWTLTKCESNGNAALSLNGTDHSVRKQSLKAPDVAFEAVLEENTRVTLSDHWQDVRFLKFTTNRGISYSPGDALAIYPRNMTEDVQNLIDLMEWNEFADIPLRSKSHRRTKHLRNEPNPSFPFVKAFTLRQLLTENLDINAIPRRSFFATISEYTRDSMHKERLLEFAQPQYLDEYYDYATRPRRSILEILQEFDSVKIPWQEAINVFPVLRPRQFSIASGGKLKQDGTCFELLVAIVKYRTVIKRIRQGVCTRYLAQLPIGSTLEVVLKTEGRFYPKPQSALTNHLLIGAGTGIAPLRALIHEKDSMNQIPSTTNMIFGCRNASSDYFFQNEWQDLKTEQKAFNIFTAFSRDQKQKVYVQDRIKEQAELVRKLLIDQEGTVIVCGSSGAMPKAVRQALVDVLCDQSQSDYFSVQEAEQYLNMMEKVGRYKQETW